MYKIWVDEAGRWPWLGPVVACAMTFNPKNMPDKDFLEKLNDSKKLTEKKREELFKELIEMSKGGTYVFPQNLRFFLVYELLITF